MSLHALDGIGARLPYFGAGKIERAVDVAQLLVRMPDLLEFADAPGDFAVGVVVRCHIG
ncbi:hypothetical protein J2W51_001513 [Tardiphaga robiniae]|uniref:hypothetical protein n=1 Tax=Tardiphaga robiniae TaxID=943830 RepID=UPI00285B360B|nr:hypothetical protein [Tardiphaga robiniae]MDR6658971.1 hypothetical protein [Tardiphaga robiniae]